MFILRYIVDVFCEVFVVFMVVRMYCGCGRFFFWDEVGLFMW